MFSGQSFLLKIYGAYFMSGVYFTPQSSHGVYQTVPYGELDKRISEAFVNDSTQTADTTAAKVVYWSSIDGTQCKKEKLFKSSIFSNTVLSDFSKYLTEMISEQNKIMRIFKNNYCVTLRVDVQGKNNNCHFKYFEFQGNHNTCQISTGGEPYRGADRDFL
jgi:hypothetical protein